VKGELSNHEMSKGMDPKNYWIQSFVLTFNQNIDKGMAFKMIICHVTKPGAPQYSGDNGSANFVGQYTLLS
jgi:hypothetical protein